MNPYQTLPARAFWRTAVAAPEFSSIVDIWRPKFTIGQDDPLITAGSCFAARLGRTLLEHGMNWVNAEPAPPGLSRPERAQRHYGEFSFRTGNIYTAAMLRQWVAWAFGRPGPGDDAWTDGARFYDPYRPSVDPDGYESIDEMLLSRARTLTAVHDAFSTASVFIFTLGLTEAWVNRADDTVFPSCPGTVRGTFDPAAHEFRNFSFAAIHHDLTSTIAQLRQVNPDLRIVLTVSPVPLTATAGADHALIANTYTKSVLRAVAGQVAAEHDHVDYFPSYELITGQPFRSAFYAPNLRSVSPEGIDFVMGHFIAALRSAPTAVLAPRNIAQQKGSDECDDAILDYYGPR